MVVAIDGYSSTGKSTVAKSLAARAGFTYLDTGAMYRAVTLVALRHGLISDGLIDEEGLRACLPEVKISFEYNPDTCRDETYLNGEKVEEEIRGMEVSKYVSPVSALGFVREFLVAQQREIGADKDVVMEGRDIGSAVFPKAELKFFMTASLAVRAERRYKELKAKGVDVTLDEVKANVSERDYQDTHRAVSPLVQPEDAILVENDNLTVEQQVEAMFCWIETVKGYKE